MKNKIIIITIFIATVFLIFLYIKNKNKEITVLPLIVISSIPKNNEFFVSTTREIILNINRNIEQKEEEMVKISIEPSSEFESVYVDKKVRIKPTTELKYGTEYKLELRYEENLLYSLVFTTNPFTKKQIDEEGGKQTQLDLDFNKEYKKFYEKYPWYQNIPIETNKYRIVYDFEESKFRIRFLKEIKVDEIENIKKEALDRLIKIGVKPPITNFYILDINNKRI